MVERGYDLFTKRCADGRGKSQKYIDSIGKGRVWDGVTAKEKGLVDEFGGLEDAIKWVAQKAKMGDDYSVVILPEQKMGISQLFGAMTRSKVDEDLKHRMGMFYTSYERLQAILGREQVLCLMEPVEINF